MNQMLWFMAVIPVLGKLWHKLKASLGYSEFQGSLTVSVPLYPQLLALPHTHTRVLLHETKGREAGRKTLRTTVKGGGETGKKLANTSPTEALRGSGLYNSWGGYRDATPR